MRYFTADLHLGHKNIVKSCKRPFKNIEEHDSYFLYLLKSFHPTKTRLYIAGDIAWNRESLETLADYLPKESHLILGNHDHASLPKEMLKEIFTTVSERKGIKIEGNKVVIDHYAGRVWSNSHWGSWQLYGHSHGRLKPVGLQHDIGVDNNNYGFLSEEDIVKIFSKKKGHHFIRRGKETLKEPNHNYLLNKLLRFLGL